MKKLKATMIMILIIGTAGIASAQDSSGNWIRNLTTREFMDLQSYRMIDVDRLEDAPTIDGRDFPEVFDWREMDGVTSVKDQAQCGSCWAFAAIGVLEAQLLIQTGVEYNLSEQQLVDCDPASYGCSGGMTESAWSYLQWEPARIEADYPYEAVDNTCRSKQYPAYVRTNGYEAFNGSVDAIKAALMDYGPVATSMGANDNLKAYSGGCYADDSNTQINHGIVIVGWDDTVCDGGSWIVKNSWGDDFGEDGFFYIRRGDVHLGDYYSMVYFEILPAVDFSVPQIEFLSTVGARPEAGDRVNSDFIVTNAGRETATGVTADLSTESSLITIINGSVTLPDLPVGESSVQTGVFEFTVSELAMAGDTVNLILTIQGDNGENQIPVTLLIGPMFPLYTNDFEGDSDEGWTHGANRNDQWVRGMHGETDFPRFDPIAPFSGTHMWGNRLSKSGNYAANHSTWLTSPVYDCTGHQQLFLRFKRWLSIEKGIYDTALLKINGVVAWENPSQDDLIDTSWQDVLLDITDFISAQNTLQIAFELTSDGGLEFGGWNIDDLAILSSMDPEFEQRFTGGLHMELGMPDILMEQDDAFLLYYQTWNYGTRKDVTEFIALEVAGQFWFWPNWTQDVASRSRSVDSESFNLETVLSFDWPAIEGHAAQLRFWSAAVDSVSGALFDYTFIEWGW